MKFPIFKIVIIGILTLITIACGGGTTGDADNYIVVEDQVLVDLNEITVSDVKLSEPAWIVIYESKGPQEIQGGVSEIIGLKPLVAGEYQSINLFLEREVVNGEVLFAELRKDGGVSGQFEPDGEDSVISQTSVASVSFLVFKSEEPYLRVGNGKIHNDRLIVEKVVSSRDSWLMVYTYDETTADLIGDRIGMQRLNAGHHSDIELLLNTGKNVTLGEKVVVALYENVQDTGILDTFDSENDLIIVSQGKKLLQTQDVTVDTAAVSCDACIKFEVSADPFAAYYIWNVEGALNQGLINDLPGNSNKKISLMVSNTYQITNSSPNVHPFVLLGADNEILLSQDSSTPGSFAEDSNVAFKNDGGVMTFTLTPELAEKLQIYACRFHGQMTGPIEIIL